MVSSSGTVKRCIWSIVIAFAVIATAISASWLTWGLFDYFRPLDDPTVYGFITAGAILTVIFAISGGFLAGFACEMVVGNSLKWLRVTSSFLWILLTSLLVGSLATVLVASVMNANKDVYDGGELPLAACVIGITISLAIFCWCSITTRRRLRRLALSDAKAEKQVMMSYGHVTRLLLAIGVAMAIGIISAGVVNSALWDPTGTYQGIMTSLGLPPPWAGESDNALMGVLEILFPGIYPDVQFALFLLAWSAITGFMVETVIPFRRFF